jgi:uncharacterized iron-regulated membrane protein
MKETNSRLQQAKILRIFRKIHRLTGAFLFAFFFVIAITGLLLGWKKNSGGFILAKTHKGTSTQLQEWLSIDSLHKNAVQLFKDSVSATISPEIDRIDIRKEKGTVKFVFAYNFTGIQLDGATGKLLTIEKRRADFIEKLHDGSIVDYYLGIKNDYFKLFYTSIMGVALLIFTITGFWLWYGPKRMRS